MTQQSFIPADLDCGDFARLEPLYQTLLDRPIASLESARQWLADFSELSAAVSEYGSRRNIDQTCHTDDPEIEKAFLNFVENVSPKIKPFGFKLQKKLLDSGYADQLDPDRMAVMIRQWRAEVELYRDENVPLQTQVTKTYSEYDKLCGAMLVDFRGKQCTLQQLARFLEEPDRDTRRQAWELAANRRLQDREAIDGIYDKLLDLRAKIATNAGLDGYRDYVWMSFGRFDYTPQDCHDFADAVEKTCLPVVREMNRRRKQMLGVDTLRPWDLAVDVRNREPLRPFDPENVDEMVSKVGTIFDRLSPVFGEQYRTLKPGRNLDLESRKGKRPGGYQSSLEQVREPFIFMNAAGLHRDVETMLHEGGHAFHYMAARDEPIVFLRHAPLEFCEVASMSMELLALGHMDVFYQGDGVARAAREQFEGVVRTLVWIATIDQFQHWLYTHPGHTADQRTQAWLDILGRFSDQTVDYSGYEQSRAAMWQRQLHLFHYPFYYIEYGIAQLGALQVWTNYRQDGERALKQLREAFSLGDTKPLGQLFETAGIRFDFSSATLGPLIEQVSAELEALPA
jgi:oligoendopeptidase F